MRKVLISLLVVGLVLGMSMGVMAQENIADIDQASNDKGNAAGAEAYLEQIGLGNEAYLVQKTGGNTGPRPSFTELSQIGDNNSADIYQNQKTSSMNLYIYLDQEGDDNEAFLTQNTRASSDIDIDQLGDRNSISLKQLGDYSENSSFIMTQDGDDNMVVGVGKNQYGMWLNDWDNAYQTGSDFVGSQIGDENKIGLYQGDESSAVVNQLGDNNKVLLWQGDGGHSVGINQNGNNNVSEVIQTSN